MLTVVLVAVAVSLSASVCGLAAVALLRRRFVVVDVSGDSMRPSLRAGDRVLVRRVPPRSVRTGEVVVVEAPRPRAHQPEPGHRWHVKRVAAVGGDPVPARVADAPALRDADRVPAGHLVVLGDNPHASLDSRQRGFVPAELVLGVVLRPLRRPGR
ncbi:signal peptidase I [Microbispora sp. RL4-1S]|uniref:Signal peptidase I n=1 Tax=Microbispora oryzae TaxID=2806554 RepID=A0A940WU07_9ACTN|nr:signal peptidase I [Microbispora oryzae]MBP2706974.1 signal peptidase I [Microbispora oryzae]